jgi:hypothetical protein
VDAAAAAAAAGAAAAAATKAAAWGDALAHLRGLIARARALVLSVPIAPPGDGDDDGGDGGANVAAALAPLASLLDECAASAEPPPVGAATAKLFAAL